MRVNAHSALKCHLGLHVSHPVSRIAQRVAECWSRVPSRIMHETPERDRENDHVTSDHRGSDLSLTFGYVRRFETRARPEG
jgi:hypothetical protein